MARQIINIGTRPRDRSGDSLRTTGTKINANFAELYQLTGASSGLEPLTFSANTLGTLETRKFSGGKVITFIAPTAQFANAVAFESRSANNQLVLDWNQTFIDTVWDGDFYNFSVSLDSGNTWIDVEQSGYNGGSFFYFQTLYDEVLGTSPALFTYTENQPVRIRYFGDSTSANSVWFNPAESQGFNANTFCGAKIDFSAMVRIEGPTESVEGEAVYFGSIWVAAGDFTNSKDPEDFPTDEPMYKILSGSEQFMREPARFAIAFRGTDLNDDNLLDNPLTTLQKIALSAVFTDGRHGKMMIFFDSTLYSFEPE